MVLTELLGPVRKRNYVADAAYVRRSLDDAPAAAPAKGGALVEWVRELAALMAKLEKLPIREAERGGSETAGGPRRE